MPAPSQTAPDNRLLSRMRENPNEVTPRHRMIQASLPSADGQYTKEGMNISINRYVRSLGYGANFLIERQNSKVPMKLNVANTKNAASSDAGTTVYTKPVSRRMNAVPV